MPYEKINWEDFPSTATPIDAESLRHMERQYEEAINDQVPALHTFSHAGDLTVKTGTHRLYNDTDQSLSIAMVRASVSVPSTGAGIVVDVHKNGTTIFTNQANRPTIPAAQYTITAVPAVTEWAPGEFLTVDVDQVGSTVAGTDLTVTLKVRKVV